MKLESPENRGKFIVIYGSNNLGKTVQINKLANRLIDEGHQVIRIKYPVYGIQPTGPIINDVLRNGKKMSETDLQTQFAQNRMDFQETIISILNARCFVVAEDYLGTGIAWGMTRDIPLKDLEEKNDDLIIPDLAILLDGERFSGGKENGHRNEDGEEGVWDKNRRVHQELAERYGWVKVNANRSIDDVQEEIWQIVGEHFFQY